MTYFFSGAFVVIFLFLGGGCAKLEVTRAFQGEFNSQRNNKVIGTYCTSCHIHKEFDPKRHVVEMRPEYRRSPFRTTTECRTCHYIEKQWTHNEVLRKTRRPQEVNQGDFGEFEKKFLKTPEKAGGVRKQEEVFLQSNGEDARRENRNRLKKSRQQKEPHKSKEKLRKKENEYRAKYSLGKTR